MNKKALQTVRRYEMLKPNDRVVIGVSGGADSMALLCFLLSLKDEFGLDLAVCHINHALRGEEAERDERFVRDFCARRALPFYALHCDVAALARAQKRGVEECGRTVRYRFFEQTANTLGPDTKIATAHNLEDNTETVLLHLLRGCAPNGLCGIAPVRGRIIRPLIECSRREIEAYLACLGQSYLIDSTNTDTHYRRNFLRQEILPRLRSRMPLLDRSVQHLTQLSREQHEFFKDAVSREYRAVSKDGGLLKDALACRNIALQRGIIAAFFRDNNIELSFERIDALLSAVQAGRFPFSLPGGRLLCCSQDGLVTLAKPAPAAPAPFAPTLGEHCLPDGSLLRLSLIGRAEFKNFQENSPKQLKNCLNYAIIDESCLIRPRRGGDVISLFPRFVTKTLKKLFNETKIPVEKRNIMPLLARENRVLWVPGLGIGREAAVTEDTEQILLIELVETSKETETTAHAK